MTVEKYAVIGNPIEHSKSPLIHQAFAKQFGKTISYEKILAPLDGFVNTVKQLQADGYRGANVTVPFKFEAYRISDSVSVRSKAMGAEAVNTISFLEHGQIHGDNTDGAGIRTDIEKNLQFTITGKRILILGAGGAAHGVLNSLIGASKIVIANRTADKALRMVFAIQDYVDTSHSGFEQLSESFDLIVNATSAGLTDKALPLPNIIFGTHTLAYDMMYGRETPFMMQARANGATVADGLGMLVEQAAEAFAIWHRVQPDTAPVLAMLRENQR